MLLSGMTTYGVRELRPECPLYLLLLSGVSMTSVRRQERRFLVHQQLQRLESTHSSVQWDEKVLDLGDVRGVGTTGCRDLGYSVV